MCRCFESIVQRLPKRAVHINRNLGPICSLVCIPGALVGLTETRASASGPGEGRSDAQRAAEAPFKGRGCLGEARKEDD